MSFNLTQESGSRTLQENGTDAVLLESSTGAQDLTGTGIGSAEAFGSGSLSLTLDGTARGVTTAEAFGAGSLSLKIDGTGQAVPTAEAFGGGIVNVSGGPQSLAGTGIGSAEAFGAGSLTLTITGTGINSAEAFGAGSLSLNLGGTGIGTAEAFGSGTVTATGGPLTIDGTGQGIPTATAFGAGSLTGAIAGAEDLLSALKLLFDASGLVASVTGGCHMVKVNDDNIFPYLEWMELSAHAVLTTESKTVLDKTIVARVYAADLDTAGRLGDIVHDAYKARAFDWPEARTTQLVRVGHGHSQDNERAYRGVDAYKQEIRYQVRVMEDRG